MERTDKCEEEKSKVPYLPPEIWVKTCGHVYLDELHKGDLPFAYTTSSLRNARMAGGDLFDAAGKFLFRRIPLMPRINRYPLWHQHCSEIASGPQAKHVREVYVPLRIMDQQMLDDAGPEIRAILSKLPGLKRLELDRPDYYEEYQKCKNMSKLFSGLFRDQQDFTKLQELKLEFDPPVLAQTDQPDASIAEANQIFARLKTLNVALDGPFMNRNDNQSQMLAKFLQGTTGLKCLIAHGAEPEWYESRCVYIRIPVDVLYVHLPALSIIDLSRIVCKASELAKFFKVHKKIIKYVGLKSICLTDGSWRPVFGAILRLERLRIIRFTAPLPESMTSTPLYISAVMKAPHTCSVFGTV